MCNVCIFVCVCLCVWERGSNQQCLTMCDWQTLWTYYSGPFTSIIPPTHTHTHTHTHTCTATHPPNAVLWATLHLQSVAMVTITTPWRQQWDADWEGGEGKAALRDERKLMAGMEEDGWYKEIRRGNAKGDSAGVNGGRRWRWKRENVAAENERQNQM